MLLNLIYIITLQFCLLMMLISCPSAFSQNVTTSSEKKLYNQAEALFYNEDYKSALQLFQKLYELKPRDPLYNFYLGVCYLKALPDMANDINKAKAITLLEYAEPNIVGADVFYYLGSAYHLTYQFEKAIRHYKQFIDSLDRYEPVYLFPLLKRKETIAKAERNIEMCKNAIVLMRDTVNVEFENIGSKINSPYPDYAPAISADNEVLIFTSRRPSPAGGSKMDVDYMYDENIYITYKKNYEWTEAVPISENINTGKHNASIGLSSDAQALFVYYSGDIYMSQLDGEIWTKPKKLGKEINTPAWETHISMTSSKNTIYFVSNRKGGYGGRDIYKARLLSSGEWGNVENLGPVINTPYDEDAPFIYPDESRLYFSSTGHNSMGGFDIFYAKNEDGKWETPENMGYPINTPDDDVYFTMSLNGKSAYISTVREGGFGEKDIYEAKMPDAEEVPLTVIRGMIRGHNKQGLYADFKVTDVKTNQLVGLYKSNAATGKYLLVIPTGVDYNFVITSEGFTPHSEKIHIPDQKRFYDLFQEIQLTPAMATDPGTHKDIIAGQKIFIRNAFFDIDSAIALTDRELLKFEVKELSYSSFLGKLERSDPQVNETLFSMLDTIEGIGGYIDDYKPTEQVHLTHNLKKDDLEMHVMGYDTIYTTSAATKVESGELALKEIKLQPTDYVSQEEMDTAKIKPEYLLTVKGLKEGIEEAIEQEETSGKSIHATEQKTDKKIVPAMPESLAGLKIIDAENCSNVENRIPTGIANNFSSDIGKVYLFTKVALNGVRQSVIHHIWYYKDKLMADVELEVKNPLWRTWSYKTMMGNWKGQWRVDITGPDGEVIKSVSFTLN